MNPTAFTSRNDSITPSLITPCAVCASCGSVPPSPQDLKQYNALWDTGATGSVISVEVAQDLHLAPISQCKAYHAQGEKVVNVYLIDILLLNNVWIKGVRVIEGNLKGSSVLIGMDIINLGDFVLTHKNNKTVFSFQIPPTHEYDFVKQIQQGVGMKIKGNNKKNRRR